MAMPVARLGRLLAIASLVVVFLLPLAATIHVRLAGPHLDELSVGVQAPAMVAQAVADRIDGVPGRPIDAVVVSEDGASSDVRERVATGDLDAAVVVDLAESTDVLLVPEPMSAEVVDQVTLTLEAVGESYGRSLRVVDVPPPRSAGAWPGLPFALVVAWVLLGVAAATGVSAWRGRVPRTAPRVVGLGLFGLAVGVVSALVVQGVSDAASIETAIVGTATVVVCGWLALALEVLFGLVGVGVATALLVGPAAPLAAQIETRTMPTAWPALYSIGPHDAALSLASRAVFGLDTAPTRPWLLLAAWAVIPLVTLAVTRAERPRSTVGGT